MVELCSIVRTLPILMDRSTPVFLCVPMDLSTVAAHYKSSCPSLYSDATVSTSVLRTIAINVQVKVLVP